MVESEIAKRDIRISKALSYLLRHGAVKEGLSIDSDGYVDLSALLKHNRLKTYKCTRDDIHRVVETNEKKRFNIKKLENVEYICAVQGHSMKIINPDGKLLERITTLAQLPDTLVHGTTISSCIAILESGAIKKCGRNHVHLATGITGVNSSVISGMRLSSPVHIYLNLDKSLIDGIGLVKSLNNVYLTEDDIGLTFFKKVVIKLPIENRRKKAVAVNLAILLALLQDKNIPYEMLDGNSDKASHDLTMNAP
ncbi:tRNA 2'-phosphotransferase NDAI_0G04120 [Naumovozyma dairenensis CBS 421]|uniref:2'-phosphotransferase n=1 Tax=Naumovozyma dairenensis (strain ATCC 10597 / BCRC 20456 / CBS 421 / NBRC 0211 / NRRL Y-12639) TaxID=1071378 RepID=J7RT68_NAUDC|nr:hypothetical protein NDAI_0G04120 [Naumovozyma dairenensis CBS 421]CCK73397.1 hypothetical protein NDAI_0G04120 [Naumovozyma dairenensis CBS 421]